MQTSKVVGQRRGDLSSSWKKGNTGAKALSVGLLAASSVSFSANVARAEAGIPACRPASVVELFAGAPGCEHAAYLVIELGPSTFPGEEVGLYVQGLTDGQYVNLQDVVAPDAGAGMRVLIGTAAVSDAFGVAPDVVVDQLPFSHDWGLVDICYDEVRYSARFGTDMCAGDALRREDGRWVNSLPDPVNSNGQNATRWQCPAASWAPSQQDAGVSRGRDAAAPRVTAVDAAAPNAVAPGLVASDAVAPGLVAWDAATPSVAARDGSVAWVFSDAGARPVERGLCDDSVLLSDPPVPPPRGVTSADTSETGAVNPGGEPTSSGELGSTPAAATSGAESDTQAPTSGGEETTESATGQLDAGLATSPTPKSEGCDCRVGRGSTAPSLAASVWALCAAGFVMFRRRRSAALHAVLKAR